MLFQLLIFTRSIKVLKFSFLLPHKILQAIDHGHSVHDPTLSIDN